jgi:uncharacterized membrane protein
METHMKRFFQRAALLFFISFLWASSSWAQANVVGQWVTLPYQMPMNPVHGALLNTGKVLVVSGSGWVAGNTNLLASVWDPQAGTITQQKITWDMWCNGTVILPDGRVFVNGGTVRYDPFYGSRQSAAFDPATQKFTNLQNMAHGRWYPSVVELGDGRIMSFSGLGDTGNTNSTVEIYSVSSGWSPAYTAPFTPPLYPWLHLLPNGKVFDSGSSPVSNIFDPSTNTWATNVASTNFGGTRTYGSSVLLPLTPANGYKPVVMIMGGANPATATTELIDLSASKPKWVYGPPMSHARIELSAVTLPTGKILVLGGSTNDEDASTAALNADLYDPNTGTIGSFSAAGTSKYPRLYHSVALLLPDGTVWVAGSNPQRGTYEPHMEVYSPAYLFTTNSSGQVIPATRPTISGVGSNTMNYASAFQVQTPDAADISSVVLVKPGADTHAFNMDQRLVGLSFTAGSGALNVTGPPNSNIAPPGYYMLFILNSSGVPSVAKFIQLPVSGSSNQAPTGSITSPLTDVTIGAGQSVNFAGSGTDPNGTITGYSWVFSGGNPSSSTLQNPGSVSYSTAGTYTASLTVTDNSGLSDPNPPTRTITVVPNFALSATPASQSTPKGSGTSYTTTVTGGTGFNGTVSLSVSGLPTGATGSFSPSSVTGSGNSTLNVSTSSTTPTGTYTLTISGTSGGLTQTKTVSLVVTATVDFSLAITPGSQTVIQGSNTNFTSTVTSLGGFSGSVGFSITGLPTGATASFSPTTVTGSGSTTLTVAASATATTGAFTLTITGTSGNLTHSSTTNLLLLSSSAPTLVSLAVTPANPSILAGGTQQFNATGTYSDSSTQNLTSSVTWTSSTPGAATINNAGLATGVAAGSTTIQAASGAVSGSTTLTVTSNLPGQVGHWAFDASSGTTAVDSSGGGHTATLFNGVTWVPGKVGNAISANTTNQYASTGSINLSTTNAVTIALWVNRTYTSGGTNGNTLFEFSTNYNNNAGVFALFPDEAPDCGVTAMEIGINGNSGYNIKCYSQPTSGAWHHLAVVYDMSQAAANEVNLYIDGVLQTALKQTYSSNNSGNFGNFPLYLFSRAGTTSYSGGQMDDLQLYSRALSAAEIQQVYVGATPAPDFTLSSLPASQTINQGDGTAYTPAVAAANGFSGAVSLSVSGLPTGATGTFTPPSITGSGTSTLNVTISGTTPTGSYTLTITGTSGALTHSSTATLVVNAAPVPDFSLARSPASQTVTQGAGTSYTQTVTAANGFSGAVDLSVSGLPTGATGTFNPTSVTGSGTSTLTVTTLGTTPTGSYTLTITGTSGGLTHSATATLVVNAPVVPDFTLAASPASRTVTQGGGTSYTPTVTAVNGFSGAVAFSVSGLPTDATGTFNPTSVTGSGSSTLTVTSAATTPTGTYTLTITGTSGALTHSTTTTFVVNAPIPPDFTLSSTPASQSVTQGGSTTYTPSVSALNGFSGAVALSVSGLPTGATGTFDPTPVNGSGSSTLTVTTATTTPTGTYTLTITGTSGALTHTATATLVVNAPAAAKFTLTATPSSRTIAVGNSTTYSVKMTTLSGFTGSVVFGVTDLPVGASGGFNRASRTSSGSTTLTVSTTSSVPPGSYPLTITGTNSGLIQSVPVTLVISGPPTADVSPSPLDFGNVTTGTNTTLNLTVTNTGAVSLSGGNFSFGGGTPQPYTRITSGTFPAGVPNCGTSLAVGASCTIKVRFAPTTATTFNRTLTVAYTSATVTGSPVSLTGTGVTTSAAAVLSVSPSSIDFGSVPRGSTSNTPGDITISDTGTITLTGLTIIDPDATHFPGTGSTCGTSLAPGQSCTISGVFVPGNTLGTVNTTLTISSSNGGTETVSLSGTGT